MDLIVKKNPFDTEERENFPKISKETLNSNTNLLNFSLSEEHFMENIEIDLKSFLKFQEMESKQFLKRKKEICEEDSKYFLYYKEELSPRSSKKCSRVMYSSENDRVVLKDGKVTRSVQTDLIFGTPGQIALSNKSTPSQSNEYTPYKEEDRFMVKSVDGFDGIDSDMSNESKQFMTPLKDGSPQVSSKIPFNIDDEIYPVSPHVTPRTVKRKKRIDRIRNLVHMQKEDLERETNFFPDEEEKFRVVNPKFSTKSIKKRLFSQNDEGSKQYLKNGHQERFICPCCNSPLYMYFYESSKNDNDKFLNKSHENTKHNMLKIRTPTANNKGSSPLSPKNYHYLQKLYLNRINDGLYKK